jgi:flagellar biogenesis protein FliO
VIPFKPADDLWSTLAPGLAMLVVLAAIAAFVVWYSKRRGVTLALPARHRRLRVVERLALSRHASLVVVEYDGKPLLIGEGATGVSLLSAAAPENEADARH